MNTNTEPNIWGKNDKGGLEPNEHGRYPVDGNGQPAPGRYMMICNADDGSEGCGWDVKPETWDVAVEGKPFTMGRRDIMVDPPTRTIMAVEVWFEPTQVTEMTSDVLDVLVCQGEFSGRPLTDEEVAADEKIAERLATTRIAGEIATHIVKATEEVARNIAKVLGPEAEPGEAEATESS